jgi:hypothetical protein
LLEVDQDGASRLRIAQEPAPRVASLAALLAASAAGFLSRHCLGPKEFNRIGKCFKEEQRCTAPWRTDRELGWV